jgi:hypothetical protein
VGCCLGALKLLSSLPFLIENPRHTPPTRFSLLLLLFVFSLWFCALLSCHCG